MSALGIVLVIEDDAATRDFLAEVLSDEGYTVHLAVDAVSGIMLLTDVQPDLILCDYRLPRASGLTFARAIRNIGIDVPIVLMTADSHIPEHPNMVQVAFCLLKPFDVDELLDCITQHMCKK